ncbi:DUF530 family protein [Candidatus Micrarchaeota archaeon]|nr:DUF530 family protein [Candidatus Micrarchaeota archaeon]
MVALKENEPSIKVVFEAHELFSEIKQGYKEQNLGRLVDLKDKMIMKGFDAPFKAVLKKTTFEGFDEESAEQIADIKKQVDQFRYLAMLKKSSLRRVYVGIAAHKLAETFLKLGYGDILSRLPLDGNYIDGLFRSGADGVKTYRFLMDELEAKGRKLPIYIVTVMFSGEKFKVKIKNRAELDEKIARDFGPDAQVVNVRTSTKEYPLIKSKSVRVALVSSIISYVSDEEKNKKELKKKCTGLLLSPIFKFYLLNSPEERKKNNLYPTLMIKPSAEQLEVLSNMKTADKELGIAGKIIEEKMKIEESGGKIKSRELGAGLLKTMAGKNDEWIIKYLGVKKEEIEKGVSYLEVYKKEGRGREFLKKVKD